MRILKNKKLLFKLQARNNSTLILIDSRKFLEKTTIHSFVPTTYLSVKLNFIYTSKNKIRNVFSIKTQILTEM